MLRLIALAALVAATPALAGKPDRPHREWGKTVALDMAFNDAVACIATQMGKTGSVVTLPVDRGMDIDWTPDAGFTLAGKGEPYITMQVRNDGGVTLGALYRHPMSARTIDKTVAGLAKRCLVLKPQPEG